MSSQPQTPQELAELVAPTLLGMMITCPLYGIAIAQTMSYYRTYSQDFLYIKFLVGALITLDTAHTVCLASGTRYWFLETKLAQRTPKTILATFFFSYAVVSIVQSAYGLRVWHISGKRKWIFGTILFCSFTQLVAGMGVAVHMTIGGTPGSIDTLRGEVFATLQLGISVVCDVLITVTLVYFLSNSRTGIQRTENIIDNLIRYAFYTGLVTSILTILNIVIWWTMQDNFDFIPIHFILPKIYVNSLLASLNSRIKLRQDFSLQRFGAVNTISAATTDISLTELHTASMATTRSCAS